MSRRLAFLVLLAALLSLAIPATAETDAEKDCTWEALMCIQSVWNEYYDCHASGGSNCAGVRDFQLEVCIMMFEWCDA